MPLGSQEGDGTSTHALEFLKAEGRGTTIDLRELALELQDLIDSSDNAAVRDVAGMLASRLVERVDAPHAGDSGRR